jgi:hypothetical protein
MTTQLLTIGIQGGVALRGLSWIRPPSAEGVALRDRR